MVRELGILSVWIQLKVIKLNQEIKRTYCWVEALHELLDLILHLLSAIT